MTTAKCITFDITNTLIRINGSPGKQYARILAKKFNYNLNAELVDQNFKHLFKEQNRINPGYGFAKGVKAIDWWSNIVKSLLMKNAQVKNNSRLLSDCEMSKMSAEVFNEFAKAECWQTYENCTDLLEELKRQGFRLGVISNFDERLLSIIESLGIRRFFDFVLIPAVARGGSYKPQRAIFEQAFELSGVARPGRVVHVGDSLELDYEAARRAGFQSILLTHRSMRAAELLNDDDSRMRQPLLERGDCAVGFGDLLEKISQKYARD